MKTITLKHPIKRGETEIKEVTLQPPTAGAMRGLKLGEVMVMDVACMLTLIPRLCELTSAEIEHPANLAQLSLAVVSFLEIGEEAAS